MNIIFCLQKENFEGSLFTTPLDGQELRITKEEKNQQQQQQQKQKQQQQKQNKQKTPPLHNWNGLATTPFSDQKLKQYRQLVTFDTAYARSYFLPIASH